MTVFMGGAGGMVKTIMMADKMNQTSLSSMQWQKLGSSTLIFGTSVGRLPTFWQQD